MDKRNVFTACVVGGTSLALQCARAWLSFGHAVVAVVSVDGALLEWAEHHDIPCYARMQDLLMDGAISECDVLLSIVNQTILTKDALAFATMTINYHDSLLPRYAGVHATSWALLNGETTHGISWHLVDEGIDTGDVLKQVAVPVEADDTAFSLNMRCYEAALIEFEALIQALVSDQLEPAPQDFTKRSYVGAHKKLPGNGLIAWSDAAALIDQYYRASSFGPYTNRLGTLKFIMDGRCFVVHELHVLASRTDCPPGQVIHLTDDAVHVSTGTSDIALIKLADCEGHFYEASAFIEALDLTTETRLPVLSDAVRESFERCSSEISRHEVFWRHQLQQARPIALPYFEKTPGHTERTHHTDTLPEAVGDSSSHIDALIAAFAVYCYRLQPEDIVTLGYAHDALENETADFADSVENTVPLTIAFNECNAFNDILTQVSECRALLTQRKTYLRDLSLRYPDSNGEQGYANPAFIPCSVMITDAAPDTVSMRRRQLMLLISPRTRAFTLLCVGEPSAEARQRQLALISQHLTILLAGALESPSIPITQLPLLSAVEQQALLPQPATLPKIHRIFKPLTVLFEEQVAQRPDHIAVEHNGETVTYAALNTKAHQLASYLQQQGAKTGDYIAICLPRSPDVIVCILAILKVGGIYVPIAPNDPDERIRFILEDTASRYLLSTPTARNTFPLPDACTLLLLEHPDVFASEQAIPPIPAGEHLAYVMYTSGSTGQPKGVLVTQQGVSRLVLDQNYITFTADDVVTQIANICFDGSTFEIWGALLNGGTLRIIPAPITQDFVALADYLNDHCSITFLPTALFHQLANAAPHAFDGLKAVVFGGEAASPDVLSELLSRKEDLNLTVDLVNGYGPTENTTFSVCHRVESLQPDLATVPIGQTIHHSEAYVLDAQQALLPEGAIGELYLGGLGLAAGYLNQPQLTENAFIPNPFSEKGLSSKLYKTGDRVRRLPDGNLLFVERCDHQVKLRGFRIELNEVEHHLAQHPHVQQALAVPTATHENQNVNQLIAYLVPTASASLDVEDVKEFMEKRLPRFMIPSQHIVLEAFPLNANGKVDVKKLIESTAADTTHHCVPPQNELQKQLVAIWKEVLGVEQVGITDDFFVLGGDSISSIHVATKLRAENLKIKATDLFTHPTIVALSNIISTVSSQHIPVSVDDFSGKKIPLTPIQHWFFEQQYTRPEQFSQSVYLEMETPLDRGLLVEAFAMLFEQHPMLRAQFRCRQMKGWEQTLEEDLPPFSIADYTLGDRSKAQARVYMNECRSTLHDALDLKKSELVKAACFKGNKGATSYLLIIIHHLVVDTISWRILLQQLSSSYVALQNHQPCVLPERTHSFAQWSTALSASDKGNALTKNEEAFWLKNASTPFALPIDFDRGANTEGSCVDHGLTLDHEYSRKLFSITKLGKVRARDVIFCALIQTFFEWTDTAVFYCHLERHGREAVLDGLSVDNTVGWFTAMFPLLFNLQASAIKDISQLFIAVRAQLTAIQRGGTDYGVLRYLTSNKALAQQASKNPPPISVNYLGKFTSEQYSAGAFKIDEQGIQLLSHPDNARAHLIDIMAWFADGLFSIKWSYSSNHFKASTIEKMGQAFFKHLREAVDQFNTHTVQYLVPSDFPLAHLKQSEITQSFRQQSMIENILPLTVMQEGLLFHALYEKNTDVYLVQAVWEHHATFDDTAMQKAWLHLMHRHPVLRAAFFWQAFSAPVQVIDKKGILRWERHDFSHLTPAAQDAALKDFYDDDRKKKFELNAPSLFRVTAIKLKETSYKIVFTHHHMMTDGWGLGRILSDLYQFYQNTFDGQRYYVYEDYFRYTQQLDKNKQLSFWQAYLDGFSGMLQLPVSSAHVPPKQARKGLFKKNLSNTLLQSIKQCCEAHALTTNVFMQTAWAILLHRYTREEDIVFGVTFTKRPSEVANIDQMVGLFINTLPFRMRFKEKSTGVECVTTVKDALYQMMEHGFVSLADVQTACGNPHLFDTLFVFENYPLAMPKGVSNLQINELTHYSLTLAIIDHSDLGLQLTYDTHQFEPAFIDQMMRCYEHLLQELTADLSSPISSLKLLSPEEEQGILALSMQSHQTQNDVSVVHSFETQVRKQPQKTAVVYEEETLSYEQLNQKADQLACYLKENGVGSRVFVALYLERGFDMLIAILAVLKAGGAYVPIDQHAPQARIAYIVEDSHAHLLLTTENLLQEIEQIASEECRIICLDRDQTSIASATVVGLSPPSLSDLAYVIYTSGSTGKPKGVPITHKNLARLFSSTEALFHFNETDRWTLFHSYAFDFSVWEIWGALIYGGELVIVPHIISRDPKRFYNLLLLKKITVLNQTPAAFKQLLEYSPAITVDKHSLRRVIFGGEKLNPQLLRPFATSNKKNILFLNMYGITEITIHASYHLIDLKRETTHSESIVGLPLPDTTFYLLDKNLRIVPNGVPAELYIGGPGLAMGYLNRTNLTAQKFIEYSVDGRGAQRLYKTGDLLRRLDDGNFEYLGRLDEQVQLNGFRIELEEIETCIKTHSKIKDAAVIIKKHNGNKQLIAYLVPHVLKDKPNLNLLRRLLEKHLPLYMLPTAYVFLNNLPINVNGKVDKKQLKNRVDAQFYMAQITYRAPESPTESILVDIWKKILNINTPVGIDDNFFKLGGHSIVALQLLSEIASRFSVALDIRTIFEAPTVSLMAEAIMDSMRLPLDSRQSNAEIPSPLIQLSQAPQRPNLFLIHPVGGTVFWFASLARYLGNTCTLYGIQDPGLSTGSLYFSTVEEMAAFYLSEILKVQSQGPFFLGGASFGATVAIEVAQQLISQGHEIAFFASLDGWACYPDTLNTREFLEQNMQRQHQEMSQKLVSITDSISKPMIDLHWHRAKLLEQYRLKPIDFKLTLFKSMKTMDVLAPVEEPYNHWRQWAEELVLLHVPGDHETMFYDPHVAELARLMIEQMNMLQFAGPEKQLLHEGECYG